MRTTEGAEFRFPPMDGLLTPEEAAAMPPGGMFHLTCANHPEGRWLTKHPTHRSIHFVGWFDLQGVEYVHEEFRMSECPCPYGDLRVVTVDGFPV